MANQKMKPNYHSVIAIGGFNPAILTPDFLQEHCSFQTSREPVGHTTPVTTKFKYGNVEFLMELNRFQIKLDEIEKFNDRSLHDIMLKYLDILEYTPVTLLGMNFNYLLTDVNTRSIADLFREPLKIGDKLDIIPTAVSMVARKADGEGLVIVEASTIRFFDEKIKNTIKFTFGKDSLTVNNNFELGDLEENRNDIYLMDTKFADFLKANEDLIIKLGEF